jgi:hypothetical protein
VGIPSCIVGSSAQVLPKPFVHLDTKLAQKRDLGMTKVGWLLVTVASLITTAVLWSAYSHQIQRSRAKSILVVQPVVFVQESNVAKEQKQDEHIQQVGQSGGQFGNFQGAGGSFNGGSFQGGFCGSLGAVSGSLAK